jgi:ribonuclease VapC
MFVDASAIVAILTREPDADDLIDRLERATRPITSAIAVFEATLGLCRKRHVSVEEAEADLADFLKAARVELVPIAPSHASVALGAFARYGKGRGHPAQLTASPTRWRGVTAPACYSKVMISARLISDRSKAPDPG